MALAVILVVGVSPAVWSAVGLDHAWVPSQSGQTACLVASDLADPPDDATGDLFDADHGDDEAVIGEPACTKLFVVVCLLSRRAPLSLVCGCVHQPEPPPDRMG
jgi:hypothetical protein